MMEWSLGQIFPGFLLSDRDGYAMGRAIEAMLRYAGEVTNRGIGWVQDVQQMPEWRLDMLAQEMNCLYDYNAGVEMKREWIQNALPLYRLWGTKGAIEKYLSGFFEDVELEEWWEYGGDPYHFRVTVAGEWTAENEAWLRKAVKTAKNVRSVLDSAGIGSRTHIAICCEGREVTRFGPPMTGEGVYAGTSPKENTGGYVTEGTWSVATEAKGHKHPYTMTGTAPEETTVGGHGTAKIKAQQEARGYKYPYEPTDEETQTGQYPETNRVGMLTDGETWAISDGKATAFTYSPCAEIDVCGENF